MKYFILILIIEFLSITLKAQNKCPNTSKCGDIVVDTRDGEKYPTVLIGTQCWFQINLKATKYVNGDAITNVTSTATWTNQTTEAYCWYNNDAASYKDTYGALYNWYAVTDSRGICPLGGWYVPTNDDWNVLFNYLGGKSVAGGEMKEAGFTHWGSPNTGATNSSGLTILPGGYRYGILGGAFQELGINASIWGVTVYNAGNSWYCYAGSYGAGSDIYWNDKGLGCSVRCVRNN